MNFSFSFWHFLLVKIRLVRLQSSPRCEGARRAQHHQDQTAERMRRETRGNVLPRTSCGRARKTQPPGAVSENPPGTVPAGTLCSALKLQTQAGHLLSPAADYALSSSPFPLTAFGAGPNAVEYYYYPVCSGLLRGTSSNERREKREIWLYGFFFRMCV